MKPTLLLAAGCSWVAGRAIDTDPTALTFDMDHIEDPAIVKQYSFAGILQRKLGFDQIEFVAKNGASNREQLHKIVEFVNLNRNNYSKIFVLWGLTSIHRWEIYSNIAKQLLTCMFGRKFKNDELNEEVKYYSKHFWNKEYELKKLQCDVLLLNGYLKSLEIDHVFFNAFQSLDLNMDIKEFYCGDKTNNDMLSFLCNTNNVKISQSKFPWLNLLRPREIQFNTRAVLELANQGWLDQATKHPTIKAHSLIAEELYKFIRRKIIIMITIYSKNNCPFCDKAKGLLKLKGIEYTEIKIDEVPEAREFVISEGHRTVPQIYRDGKLLVEGGFQGLQKQPAEFFETLKG